MIKKYSLDVVLVDDRELGVLEVHEGHVNAPGRVRDDQPDQEQEARLRDKESQPLQTLRLRCQCNDGLKCKDYLENLEEDGEEDCGEDEEGNEGELEVVGVEVDHEAGTDGGVDGLVVGGVGRRV